VLVAVCCGRVRRHCTNACQAWSTETQKRPLAVGRFRHVCELSMRLCVMILQVAAGWGLPSMDVCMLCCVNFCWTHPAAHPGLLSSCVCLGQWGLLLCMRALPVCFGALGALCQQGLCERATFPAREDSCKGLPCCHHAHHMCGRAGRVCCSSRATVPHGPARAVELVSFRWHRACGLRVPGWTFLFEGLECDACQQHEGKACQPLQLR
jgi:hypothetical protein